MNVTPNDIVKLNDGEIFVYGSNILGKHGLGAAKTALLKFGAEYGRVGYCGNSYGINTKDNHLKTLPLSEIAKYVNTFTLFAKHNPQLKMLVTSIGTGLAGLRAEQIAPMFLEASKLSNVWLPKSFWDVLNK